MTALTAPPLSVPPSAQGAPPRHGLVTAWLGVVAALVFVMIVVGGLTRLTDSGLSITEWKPITGALPPLSAEAWRTEFAKYQAIPEYQIQNRGMSLAAFKAIYWWEWGHRQLGRLIGLAYALPLFTFWALGRLPAGLKGRFVVILALGGLQGAIGWWMVASGLSARLDVSHYRLAVHLGVAFLLFGALIWTLLDVRAGPRRASATRAGARAVRTSAGGRLALWTGVFAAAVFVQVLLGALVAGLDAGRVYVDWPLMGGRLAPEVYGDLGPWWRDAFENRASVQFHHRLGGYGLALGAVALAAGLWRARTPRLAVAIAAVTVAQVALGVITLINVAPLGLSAAHQATAALLFALAVAAVHHTRARQGRDASASMTVSSPTTLTVAPSATTTTP